MLKIAKVIALFKSGSTEEVNNYRPISLLPIFDKIIEKLMHKQLYKFLEDHEILFKNQFGFRKKCSTVHSLIEITEKIKESLQLKGKKAVKTLNCHKTECLIHWMKLSIFVLQCRYSGNPM